jgi:peptidoglycan/LPS O-acetylase OafA/YrhL
MALSKAPTSNYIHRKEFDGLRGLAALMVFNHHSAFYLHLISSSPLIVFFTGKGDFAVYLFFVLVRITCY